MNRSNDMLSNALIDTTNDNISVPMGLIAPVDAVMRSLGFDVLFKGIKSKGIDLFTLVTGLMVHSMDEDNSLESTAQWMSNPVVKSIYGIPEDDNVSQKTLNRALEALGANDEAIVVGLNKGIGRLFLGLDYDAIADGYPSPRIPTTGNSPPPGIHATGIPTGCRWSSCSG